MTHDLGGLSKVGGRHAGPREGVAKPRGQPHDGLMAVTAFMSLASIYHHSLNRSFISFQSGFMKFVKLKSGLPGFSQQNMLSEP